jgi:uncharacterized protein YndB with AHSA1/START domain
MVTSTPVETELREFFAGMQEGVADLDTCAALFHEQFFSCDPAAVTLVDREQFRAALPRRSQLFGAIGSVGSRLRDLEVTTLDSRHVLARTSWDVLFEDPSNPPLMLESSYLLRRIAERWQVLVYLNLHDVVGVLQARLAAASTEPVRRSVTVEGAPESTFASFAEQIDRWWPRTGYGIGAAPLREAVLEPRIGGRWYERDDDGTECTWGRVLAWEPPHRLVLAWQISAAWTYDPTFETEVEITFTSTPAGRTRVDLEHRDLHRYGAAATAAREGYAGPTGWQGLLDAFAAAQTVQQPG